jgi:2-polyprenyl-6-methoxyphenol hydroxylase-like FAD-dependent oxidoreductase
MLRDGIIEDSPAPRALPDDCTIACKAVYRFHVLAAKQRRKGCVLLAGDAAHRMLPFVGPLVRAGIAAKARKVGAITTVSKSPVVDRSTAKYGRLCRSRAAQPLYVELRSLMRRGLEGAHGFCTDLHAAWFRSMDFPSEWVLGAFEKSHWLHWGNWCRR